MGRKVFMSVLGIGIYNECTYRGKNSSTLTRFIQEATLKDIGAESWGKEDVVCIIMTEEARKLNWPKEVTEREKDGNIHEYYCLEPCIERLALPCSVKTLDIPDGKDEDEIWKIFDTIYNFLEEGDELYFDLTHAFRYQPMLLLVLGNYAKFLKNARIAYMGYGNYEGRFKDEATGEVVAPIMDLLPISTLLDWTFAAGQFIRSGNSEVICELGRGRYAEIKREIKRKDTGIDSLKSFVESVSSLSDELMLCRGVKIIEGKEVADMRKYESLLNSEAIPAFAPLIRKITDSFSQFDSGSNVLNSYHAAKWCLEKNLYQQAVTFLRESVVSLLCEKYGLSITDGAVRKIVDDIFAEKNTDPKQKKTAVVSDDLKPLFCKLSADPIFDNADFVLRVCFLKGIRNDLNHSGMRDNPAKISGLKQQISDAVNKIGEYLLDSDLTLGRGKPAVFINYTNHPSETWGEAQLEAARKYGEVVDLPFRSIGGNVDEKSLAEIAAEETGKILEFAAGKNATVHIMGEMTLTFAIVGKLKEAGVPCVASTTARQVVDNADGTRTSSFNFVRFRKYE